MADPGNVALAIYDLHGRLVRQFDLGSLPAGRFPVEWDLIGQSGVAATPGVYFCRLTVGKESRTRKIVLAR